MSDDPSVALGSSGNMKIVNKGAPLGIVGTVCANETNQGRAIDGQLNELIARRAIEPFAPYTHPFLG